VPKKATSKPTVKKQRTKHTDAIEVRGLQDVIRLFDRVIAKNIHDRYNARLSESTRKKLVAYAPWLAAVVLLLLAPALLVLANSGILISPLGFIEKVLFNRDAWVLLIVVLINIVCTVDALSELFNKTRRGWNRVYSALLINSGYVLYQLLTNFEQPAAPLLSLIGFIACIFTMLDIREYYN
jgi:hypothetical protein